MLGTHLEREPIGGLQLFQHAGTSARAPGTPELDGMELVPASQAEKRARGWAGP
jgi:hypothetical protein